MLEASPILAILEMQTDSRFQKTRFFPLVTVKEPQGWSRLVTLDEGAFLGLFGSQRPWVSD